MLEVCVGARGEQAREEVERGRGEVAVSEESILEWCAVREDVPGKAQERERGPESGIGIGNGGIASISIATSAGRHADGIDRAKRRGSVFFTGKIIEEATAIQQLIEQRYGIGTFASASEAWHGLSVLVLACMGLHWCRVVSDRSTMSTKCTRQWDAE